jgi:general secretion pathway protein D
MAGAIRNAYETVAAGRGLMAASQKQGVINDSLQYASNIDPNSPALGQINNFGGGNLPQQLGGLMGSGSGPSMGSPMGPMNMGGGNPIGGGAAMADFDTLMNLIQQTIDPDNWLAAGGESTMLPYPANLSLVVSAPQTTHEKIAELLESLRRLQDLQVTIEVKFITLNDNFFERLGVDFDVRVDDNVRRLPEDDQGPSATVGLNAEFNPFAGGAPPVTSDLDVTFSQGSFGSAIPTFGGFDAGSGGSLGFAILSDLEMFFFMNAAQGDSRTNILQAPRVTMFDGQFASINDTVQRPFVTGLVPIVGDFAVAQQPVIVVLNEGTVLNVQATVTADKRFVRLTLNPTFTAIDRVDTFTFEGSRTTRSGSNVLDPTGNITGENDDVEEIVVGSTVQQPSLISTNISTTVSVPDGGTILLGGIKRMREGRIDRGVPILSKIPYVNRLFKNTAIGRETSTLMMTVTPRIIIQEEEEALLGVGN